MKPIVVFRHVPHESLGTLESVFADAGLAYRYVDLFRETTLDFDPHAAAGLVVLGGPMNVDETERYPFLARVPGWIEAALESRLPVLGICLGSQLLAKTLGAAVRANPIKEIGWYPIQPTPAGRTDPLLSACREEETVFQWHGDTFDLPTGAVPLARAEACAQQAFRYGEAAWGFQFHLEVSAEMIELWLTEPGGCRELAALDYIDPDEIRARVPRELPAMQKLGRRVFAPFAERCAARAASD